MQDWKTDIKKAQKAKLFADRNVREQTAKILLKSRDRYQTAANHIKRALELW